MSTQNIHAFMNIATLVICILMAVFVQSQQTADVNFATGP